MGNRTGHTFIVSAGETQARNNEEEEQCNHCDHEDLVEHFEHSKLEPLPSGSEFRDRALQTEETFDSTGIGTRTFSLPVSAYMIQSKKVVIVTANGITNNNRSNAETVSSSIRSMPTAYRTRSRIRDRHQSNNRVSHTSENSMGYRKNAASIHTLDFFSHHS